MREPIQLLHRHRLPRRRASLSEVSILNRHTGLGPGSAGRNQWMAVILLPSAVRVKVGSTDTNAHTFGVCVDSLQVATVGPGKPLARHEVGVLDHQRAGERFTGRRHRGLYGFGITFVREAGGMELAALPKTDGRFRKVQPLDSSIHFPADRLDQPDESPAHRRIPSSCHPAIKNGLRLIVAFVVVLARHAASEGRVSTEVVRDKDILRKRDILKLHEQPLTVSLEERKVVEQGLQVVPIALRLEFAPGVLELCAGDVPVLEKGGLRDPLTLV